MTNRTRSHSFFHEIDESKASGNLSSFLRESKVYLGGSSMGKGLVHAAEYYLNEKLAKQPLPDYLRNLPGAKDLNDNLALCINEDGKHDSKDGSGDGMMPIEDSFYILDIGVCISQVYQWKKAFPRVEPFYAVKCNPDPIIVKTLAILGCNFDCASRAEITLVQNLTSDLPNKPEIIYANPCKARLHLIEAVCKGVRMVTFDNVVEVQKCAAISKKIQLILRIITDDRGSQCRLSTKFGAPRYKWRSLLAAAKHHGLDVVGVSFHVGSGCRDVCRYEMALKDAKEIFDMAEREFGMKMKILDIGGGFPGETHTMWNPASEIDDHKEEDSIEGTDGSKGSKDEQTDGDDNRFLCFSEIAEEICPILDRLFPQESGIRIIAEPGRYMVAAAATLCCSVVASRSNEMDTSFKPEAIDDVKASVVVDGMTREEESDLMNQHNSSMSVNNNSTLDDNVLDTIKEGLADFSKQIVDHQLAQQEVDVYNDKLDLYNEGVDTAVDLLGPPDEGQMETAYHTVEGMAYPVVAATGGTGENQDNPDDGAWLTLAAAGEASVNGIVMHAVANSSQIQDDYAYYINDGVYSAFNNLMFDHAHVRPRVLKADGGNENDTIVKAKKEDGFMTFTSEESVEDDESKRRNLFASTIFGPTCDSIDVISRSVLLPKLKVGDWLYFQNMGAYTMAAASEFNGFAPSDKLYVCSVQPEYFEALIKGPDEAIQEK